MAQAHGSGDGPAAFGHRIRRGVKLHRWVALVVGDDHGRAVHRAQGGVGGIAQGHVERFAGFGYVVVNDGNGEGFLGLARIESERPTRVRVLAAGRRRAVTRGVINGHSLAGGRVEGRGDRDRAVILVHAVTGRTELNRGRDGGEAPTLLTVEALATCVLHVARDGHRVARAGLDGGGGREGGRAGAVVIGERARHRAAVVLEGEIGRRDGRGLHLLAERRLHHEVQGHVRSVEVGRAQGNHGRRVAHDVVNVHLGAIVGGQHHQARGCVHILLRGSRIVYVIVGVVGNEVGATVARGEGHVREGRSDVGNLVANFAAARLARDEDVHFVGVIVHQQDGARVVVGLRAVGDEAVGTVRVTRDYPDKGIR